MLSAQWEMMWAATMLLPARFILIFSSWCVRVSSETFKCSLLSILHIDRSIDTHSGWERICQYLFLPTFILIVTHYVHITRIHNFRTQQRWWEFDERTISACDEMKRMKFAFEFALQMDYTTHYHTRKRTHEYTCALRWCCLDVFDIVQIIWFCYWLVAFSALVSGW